MTLRSIIKKTIDINTEPITNRPMRSAAEKARMALKTCFWIILFHFNELSRFITIYLSVLVELRWGKDAGTVLKNCSFYFYWFYPFVSSFFSYIFVLLRTALGHRAEIFILICFPLSWEIPFKNIIIYSDSLSSLALLSSGYKCIRWILTYLIVSGLLIISLQEV